MCFFSFNDDGERFLYFDWEMRRALLGHNPNEWEPDSHANIAAQYGLDGDTCDKYEYNPLTGVFRVVQMNLKKSRKARNVVVCPVINNLVQHFAELWVRNLDFSTVVEPLVIKPIVNPFELEPAVNDEAAADLREWANVASEAENSVWGSVARAVGSTIRNCVWDSVWDSVWSSVWGSVWDSVKRRHDTRNILNDIWSNTLDSVWDSEVAYTGSFFELPRSMWLMGEKLPGEGYPFAAAVRLWERGLVPSFDGSVWQLHGGPDAEVLYEWQPKAGEMI